jgi:hypothetical protein
MGKKKGTPTPKKPRVDRSADKTSIASRTARAGQVGTVGPQSPIWQAQGTVKDLGTQLAAAGVTLAADEVQVTNSDAVAAKARSKRDGDLVAYDVLYNAYFSSAEHFSTTKEDLQGLGAAVASETVYGLGAPLDLTGKYDLTKLQVVIHVKCAPGMHRCRIEIASDQAMSANLKQFPGDGARQSMGGLPPGTWWIRAAHVRAAEVSSFTGPIAVIVK